LYTTSFVSIVLLPHILWCPELRKNQLCNIIQHVKRKKVKPTLISLLWIHIEIIHTKFLSMVSNTQRCLGIFYSFLSYLSYFPPYISSSYAKIQTKYHSFMKTFCTVTAHGKFLCLFLAWIRKCFSPFFPHFSLLLCCYTKFLS
jgi:hypothetical protein